MLLCSQNNATAKGTLKVYVDERMELLTTVQYLAGYEMITKAGLIYKHDVEAYFGKYRSHPAISLAKTIIGEGYLAGSAAPWYFYQFSFPGFEPAGTITSEDNQVEDYESHADTLALFRKQLKDFYYTSGFHRFYTTHRKFYDSLAMPVSAYLAGINLTDTMEKHFGQSRRSYNVVLSPLLISCGFGVQVHTGKGDDIYSIVGPVSDSKVIPLFPDDYVFRKMVVHEFCHSFCNPVIHKFFAQMSADSCLVDPILTEQNNQGYGGDWETCLFEHLTRANEIILVEKLMGKEKAEERYNLYYGKYKWVYLAGLIPLIKEEYLLHRDRYKTQYDLAPRIVEYLHEEKSKTCH